jgi:hypothetical protein
MRQAILPLIRGEPGYAGTAIILSKTGWIMPSTILLAEYQGILLGVIQV